MLRLIVNPGTDQEWEIPLPPGVTTLGSDPIDNLPIAHETVSASHCEIRVTDGTVTIRDLGSTCGTFVNHEQVEEASLVSGQTIHLGEAKLLLCSDAPREASGPKDKGAVPIPRRIPTAKPIHVVTAAPSPPTVVPAAAVFCKYHPKAQARWFCRQCQTHYCDLCVAVRRAGETTRCNCRACGNECEPVIVEARLPEEAGFFALLPGAFSYPFKGNGVVLLVAGTVFYLVLKGAMFLASFAPLIGLAATLILTVLSGGYLFNYAKQIITTSAAGEATPPGWPDFSDLREDVVMPFGQLIGLVALTFGPAAILRWWQPVSAVFAHAVTLTALGVAALLAPMGMLALAMFDTVASLNPIALVWSILRIPLHYLAAAAAFELVLGAYLMAENWLGPLLRVPILPGLLFGFLNLYLIVVGMRILGLLYQADKDRLSWF